MYPPHLTPPYPIPPTILNPLTGGWEGDQKLSLKTKAFQAEHFRLKSCFHFFFFFFFSVATFSHRRSALIQKFILRKLIRAPNNLGLDPFPDPVGHSVAPWRPFLDFAGGSMFLIEGVLGSKNLFCESCLKWPIT